MSVNTGQIQAGRFMPGQSGNPAGKPKGAKNRTTILAQSLLENEAEVLVRTIIELAKAGDMQALKVCIDRLCPPMKAQSALVQVEIPVTDSLSVIANSFLKAAAAGALAPDVASQLVSAVATMAHVVEIDQLKVRLAALEAAVIRK